MSIERGQSAQLFKAVESQAGHKVRSTEDAESAAQERASFAAAMQAHAAPAKPATPARPATPPPPPKRSEASDRKERADAAQEADSAERGDKAAASDASGQVAESGEAEKDDEDDKEVARPQKPGTAHDASAALAQLTAFLRGAAPASAPAISGTAEQGGALTGIDAQTAAEVADVGGAGGLVDAARRAVGGAVGFATEAARAIQTQGAAPSSGMAAYASVLEQLKNRLAGGDVPMEDAAFQAAGLDTTAGTVRPASAQSLLNARFDKSENTGMGMGIGMGTGQGLGTEPASLLGLSAEAGEAFKTLDRVRGEGGRGGAANASEGAFGQHGFTSTVQFDGGAVAAAVTGPATADAVADQVSYWVSQGIQNASLTLEGLNAERVEVRISMSGQEAQIEFRSDQAATRDMLASTAAHLKDLLGSQGVVLTGVTVGHSGAQLAGGQSQQDRAPEGQRRAFAGGDAGRQVAAAAPARAVATAPAGTLDLFV
ncbi:MAG: hypothetical protein JWQ88_2561 [Rhodoferax sp.]|nr:hypothetical protein [Rhodoferax sp.]